MLFVMPTTLEGDQELLAEIARTPWHVSPGYVAPDGQQVGPHEYILVHEDPALWDRIYQRLKRPEGVFFGTYNANRRRFRYLALGDYKYWSFRFVMNRERLPEANPIPDECRGRVTFPDRDAAAAGVRRVTARTKRDYYTFACDRGCTGWHVSPFGSPRW
jgi:hypothetical protein